MAHQSHIPKFGNWDGDNVPYTAYFENARKEKTGMTMINPNDPEQNSEAFNMCTRGGYNIDSEPAKASPGANSQNTSSKEKRRHSRNNSRQSVKGSHGSFTADFDNFALHRAVRTEKKQSMTKGGSNVSSFSSSTHSRHRSQSHSSIDYTNHKATQIPKFGAWDEKDPKSGESFTEIFTRFKDEKQIASSHFPSGNDVPPKPGQCSNTQNNCGGPSSRFTKYCCCLFSSESK